MAKRNSARGRVNTYNARQSLPLSTLVNQLVHRTLPRQDLRQYEDRREYYPKQLERPARSYRSPKSRVFPVSSPQTRRVTHTSLTSGLFNPSVQTFAFAEPSQVLICERRRARKEVLHALRKAGKVGQKRPRYNDFSKISCKRRK